jgi:hypothetical protein
VRFSRSASRALQRPERLYNFRYVAKALVAYAHWYPTFPGLSVNRLRAGSKALDGEGADDSLG